MTEDIPSEVVLFIKHNLCCNKYNSKQKYSKQEDFFFFALQHSTFWIVKLFPLLSGAMNWITILPSNFVLCFEEKMWIEEKIFKKKILEWKFNAYCLFHVVFCEWGWRLKKDNTKGEVF